VCFKKFTGILLILFKNIVVIIFKNIFYLKIYKNNNFLALKNCF